MQAFQVTKCCSLALIKARSPFLHWPIALSTMVCSKSAHTRGLHWPNFLGPAWPGHSQARPGPFSRQNSSARPDPFSTFDKYRIRKLYCNVLILDQNLQHIKMFEKNLCAFAANHQNTSQFAMRKLAYTINLVNFKFVWNE